MLLIAYLVNEMFHWNILLNCQLRGCKLPLVGKELNAINVFYRFISVASSRHSSINTDHKGVATSLHQIRRENEIAVKLRKNLEHEMVVLEERKAVSNCMLKDFACFFVICFFFKINHFKKKPEIQEYFQIEKQFGSRSGPTKCRT